MSQKQQKAQKLRQEENQNGKTPLQEKPIRERIAELEENVTMLGEQVLQLAQSVQEMQQSLGMNFDLISEELETLKTQSSELFRLATETKQRVHNHVHPALFERAVSYGRGQAIKQAQQEAEKRAKGQKQEK